MTLHVHVAFEPSKLCPIILCHYLSWNLQKSLDIFGNVRILSDHLWTSLVTFTNHRSITGNRFYLLHLRDVQMCWEAHTVSFSVFYKLYHFSKIHNFQKTIAKNCKFCNFHSCVQSWTDCPW